MIRTYEYFAGLTNRRAYSIRSAQPLYLRVRNERPQGTLSIVSDFGLAVFSRSGDECIAAWTHGAGYSNAHRHAIYTTSSGREYIRKGSSRWYLDRFTTLAF